MPIKDVICLLKAIETNINLRDSLYRCADSKDLESCLTSLGYVFDNYEFEDAVNYLHVQCQSHENVQLLFQKAEWLRYLLFVNEKSSG